MIRLIKPALALGMIGAMALAMATPSEARSGRNNGAAIGAGVAGFAVGAAVGAAAASANNGYYYNEPYAYRGGYAYQPGYAYAPAYNDGYEVDSYAYVPRGTRYNRQDPSSYYQPSGSYYNSGWNNRERALTGHDW